MIMMSPDMLFAQLIARNDRGIRQLSNSCKHFLCVKVGICPP